MNDLTLLRCQRTCLQINDQITLQATRASLKQLQPTINVEFKQTVVEQLLALDEFVVYRAMAFAAC